MKYANRHQYHLNHSKYKYVHYVVTYHFHNVLFVFLMNAMKLLVKNILNQKEQYLDNFHIQFVFNMVLKC